MNALEDMFNEKQIDTIRDTIHNDIDNGEVWQELSELLKAYYVSSKIPQNFFIIILRFPSEKSTF